MKTNGSVLKYTKNVNRYLQLTHFLVMNLQNKVSSAAVGTRQRVYMTGKIVGEIDQINLLQ